MFGQIFKTNQVDSIAIYLWESLWTRNFRVWIRKFRIYPDTPGILPDSPDLKCYITCFRSGDCSQMLFTVFSPFLTPSRAFPVLSPFPSPKHQIHHPKSIPRTKGAPIGVGDPLLQVFHLGVVSFSSILAREAYSRYQKLGLNGLIVLGCFKRFLSGQSSSHESLY